MSMENFNVELTIDLSIFLGWGLNIMKKKQKLILHMKYEPT